jgi:adenine/guanine phosphoribosyltransferase-like PRPP-binding protein
MSHELVIHSDYLDTALHPAKVKKFVNAAVKFLKPMDFDAIAFRGMSGALLAPLLAYKLHKTVIMVRKPKCTDEDCQDHSRYRVEGDINAKRYLILDDFMCSGRTINVIVKEVSKFAPDAKCIGTLFYQEFMKYGGKLEISSISRAGIL